MFCKRKCSQKLHQFHRKTSVLESLFNKAADLQVYNFIEKRLQHKCFPVKLAKFLGKSILKNICERLLLKTSTLQQKLFIFFFFKIRIIIIIFDTLKFLLSFCAVMAFVNLLYKSILSSLLCYLSSSELIDYHVGTFFSENSSHVKKS